MSELTKRARAAGRGERLVDGQLYLDLADHIEKLEAGLTQAALELDNAANSLHGTNLHGTASLFTIAAHKARALLGEKR